MADWRFNFGNRLKAIRLSRDYSQNRLSEVSGVRRDLISSYEREARFPGIDNLLALANGLHVSLPQLIGKGFE